MLLTARILVDVGGANTFRYASSARFSVGDAQTIYIQLVDGSLDRAGDGFVPPGRRYTPPSLSTLQVILDSIDNAKRVVRSATQPFSGDASIWKVEVVSTDKLRGTINLALLLTEPVVGGGTTVRHGVLSNAVLVEDSPQS